MKPKRSDYLTVLMAFAAVFLCGYGIGHLVGERKAPPPLPAPPTTTSPAWEQETLLTLQDSLALRPDQLGAVESELAKTAQSIRSSHDGAVLEYHQHILLLYERLIHFLDESQSARLRAEKNTLEKQINFLSTVRPPTP